MAQKRLFDPTKQFQVRSGALNVNGRLRVYYNNTDDLAMVRDDNGSAVSQPVILDANGRAPGLFVDDTRMYRLAVYDPSDHLLFTIPDMAPMGAAGGSVTNITSIDESITVVQNGDNVDLSVNTQDPSVLIARSAALSADGSFNFNEISHSGNNVTVDTNSKVLMNKGWYHFDIAVQLDWASSTNKVEKVTLRAATATTSVDFDESYPHVECMQLSGEVRITANNTTFPVSISGLPSGMTATVTNAGFHAILGMVGNGSGGAASLTGKVHRLLRWWTNASEADADHPVGDWLHDFDNPDPDDPSGYKMVTADDLFEWFGEGQNFELYEVDGRDGQLGWSAVYRMVTWQDQSDWWSQYAPEPGKACRIEFHRMGGYASVNYAMMIAYIRYKDEKYMRLYEIMPGQSVWIMELQPRLPYYGRDTHNGELLRVMEDGSGLEWYSPVTTRTVTVGE